MENKREYSLDFLKIAGTLMIVLHHFQQAFQVRFEHGINFYGGKFYFGYVIELFFMLSGFFMYGYIGRIRQGMRFGDFFLKRYLRFQPMMAISVIGYGAASMLFFLLYQISLDSGIMNLWGIIINALGFQHGWGFPNPKMNYPTWYISVLLQCYVWFYLIVYLSAKKRVPCQYLFTGMILLGAGLVTQNVEWALFNADVGRGLCSFFWGLILAGLLDRYEPSGLAYGAAACVVIGFPFLIAYATDFVSTNIQFTMIFLYYPALIVAFRSPVVSCLFRGRFWKTLAGVSYHVYLWHPTFFILVVFYAPLALKHLVLSDARTMACAFGCVYLFGAFSYLFLEKAADRALHGITRRLANVREQADN